MKVASFQQTPPTSATAAGKGVLLAIVLASYSMIVIDNSIVITGLPTIRDTLGFTPAALSWVQNAYALTFGGFMMLGARAGDLLGRRRVFVAGLVLFSLASLAIGLAMSPAALVAARAVQGVGAAILSPSTLALLSTGFAEGSERNKALGWYGAVGGITASVGLVVGGILADLISWRAGFFINVPIGALLVWGAYRHIDEPPRRNGRFDMPGAILSTVGVASLVYGLVHAAEDSWLHWATAAPLLGAVVLLATFLWNEHRAPQPILPLRLFANRERSGANAARVLFLGGSMGFFFYMTQYFQGVLGMRPLWAGIAFFPSMLVNFTGALVAPRLTRRFGHGAVAAGALAVSTVGLAWLGRLDDQTPFWTGVQLPMLLMGAGMGSALASLTISGVSRVAREDAGSASGLVGVAHQLGGAFGLAILVVVFAAATTTGASDAAAQSHRIASALTAGAAMLLLAVIVVMLCVPRKRGA